jgi:hypothetical protein
VRVLPNYGFHVVEVGGIQGRAGIKHTVQGRAVLLFLGSACLQAQMGHGAVNRNWNLRLRGLSGENDDVLMEGDVAAANDAWVQTPREGRGSTACNDPRTHA